MRKLSEFLFARPPFLEGVARLIDFTGSLNQHNYSKSPKESDYRALRADWEQVGEDLWDAMNEYERQHASRP